MVAKPLSIATGDDYAFHRRLNELTMRISITVPRLLIDIGNIPKPRVRYLVESLANTRGLPKCTRVIAGEFRYVGKKTDRKWEEGDEINILEFNTTKYGRSRRVIATERDEK